MSNSFTLHFDLAEIPEGGLETFSLPVLGDREAMKECRVALDRAIAMRRGVAILGMKGIGKTVAVGSALRWIQEMERLKRARDDSYRIRRVLDLTTVRTSTYREFAITIARKLSRTYSDRVQGRKKTDNEVVVDVVEMCATKRYSLLLIDEAETLDDSALTCLRDFMAKAEAHDGARFTEDGTLAGGVGVVVVGDDTLQHRLAMTPEAGERWANVITLKALTLEEVVTVYATWFPAFEQHVATVGPDAWQNYLASLICNRGPVSFRLLENHARMYAHIMLRGKGAADRESMPFNRQIFDHTAKTAAWAPVVSDKDPTSAPARSRRRSR